jgi:ATP-binding cassette subfamily B protein
VATPPSISPTRRLFGFVATAPWRYTLGAALTLGYAVCFQLIPLSVRTVVQALEEIGAASEAAAAGGVTRSFFDVPELVRGPVWILVLVSVLFACFRLASRIVMFNLGRDIEYDLRNQYFDHLQRLPQSFFHRHRTGDLMSRAVNDINSIRMFLGMGLLNILQTPVLYLGALIVMLSIDPWLTLWALVPFPLFILVARIFGRMMFRANIEAQEQLGRLSNRVQENASGVLVVRSYALEEREVERFEVENERQYQATMKVGIVQAVMFSSIAILPALSSGLVLWVGGRAVASGRLGSEELWVFWMYIGMLTFPTVMLGFVIAIVQRGYAALSRIGEILDTVPSIRNRDDVLVLDKLHGEVELRDLEYTYPGSTEASLDGVSVKVPAGSTLGIVGPVGSGKSTLVQVIPRLLEVDDGKVLVDGHDLNRLPLELLRGSIAMVPQDSFLFSTTIADNIRYGRPDASLEEVRAAAEKAQVCGDIEGFPQGFDTLVGERGITLSGGQRQRVCLARALLLDPAILILDDALSAVDHETEEAILGSLSSEKQGRTRFVVAHRISAVREADQIVVLERGRITERGTHRELVDLGGFYARLHERQKLAAELGIEEQEVVA